MAKSTVERWERSVTVPRAAQLPLLAATLAVPLAELTSLRASALKHRARRPRRPRTALAAPVMVEPPVDALAAGAEPVDLAATLTEIIATQSATVLATLALWTAAVAVAALVWRYVRG